MAKTKIESWKNQFMAGIKGDSDAVVAEKAWRGAKSHLTVEIARLEGLTVGLEDNLEEAQENAINARMNNYQVIRPDTKYIDNLLTARNNVVKAEKELKNHKEKLEFLKNELEELVKE